jgi:hypothetical protein
MPFFDFGPLPLGLGPDFDLCRFDRSFFELPEAGLTMISPCGNRGDFAVVVEG